MYFSRIEDPTKNIRRNDSKANEVIPKRCAKKGSYKDEDYNQVDKFTKRILQALDNSKEKHSAFLEKDFEANAQERVSTFIKKNVLFEKEFKLVHENKNNPESCSYSYEIWKRENDLSQISFTLRDNVLRVLAIISTKDIN